MKLKNSTFSSAVAESEVFLRDALDHIYREANEILTQHPLFRYFEKYLGGCLIVMEPDGTVLTTDEVEKLTAQQVIGYVHPLDRERYYQNAMRNAESLLEHDFARSYDALSGQAGAVRLDNGMIFSFSGFEFLELKDSDEHDSYEDIFETINLYTLLTGDFFNNAPEVNPYRFSFEKEPVDDRNLIREEILLSLSHTELIDIATKITTKGLQYNFSLLNDIFLSRVLLKVGLTDLEFAERLIRSTNYSFPHK